MNTETTMTTTTPMPLPEAVQATAQPDFVKKIGKTTYRVRVHFSTTSRETMSDKIKRLLKNEVGQM